MCCIAYENEHYINIKKGLPEIGETVYTPDGKARLAAIDRIKETVTADFGDKEFKTYPIEIIKNKNRKDKK
jgi:cell fate regulator YaaT (PSP1 superfamily)